MSLYNFFLKQKHPRSSGERECLMLERREVAEFSLSNKRAIFSNGTTTEDEFRIVKNPESSKNRGIMV